MSTKRWRFFIIPYLMFLIFNNASECNACTIQKTEGNDKDDNEHVDDSKDVEAIDVDKDMVFSLSPEHAMHLNMSF